MSLERHREVDEVPHVTRQYFGMSGWHIAITGTTGSGKTTVEGEIFYRTYKGQEPFLKQLVISRDPPGSYEFLLFANQPDCKLAVYYPKGCVFKPDGRKIDYSHIDFREFDPQKLEETLFTRFLDSDAQNYMHIIEYDCFTEYNELAIFKFWYSFLSKLVGWKDDNCRELPIAFYSDEFQDITTPRYRGKANKEILELSKKVTNFVIRNFRKGRITLVACFNQIKQVDEHLRSQFTYFMFKYMPIADHVDWTEHLASYTANCEEDEVILFLNRAPKLTAEVEKKGYFDRIFWPLRPEVPRFKEAETLHVTKKVGSNLLLELQEEDLSERQRLHPRRLARGMKILHDRYGVEWREVARIFGLNSPQAAHHYTKSYLTDEEDGEIQRYRVMHEIQPSKQIVPSTEQFLQESESASKQLKPMGEEPKHPEPDKKPKRMPAIPGEITEEMAPFAD